MKLYKVITENLELSDKQLKRVRSVHKVLRTGTSKLNIETRSGKKQVNVRYELPEQYEPAITNWGDLGMEFPVLVPNGDENDAEFPCKVWLLDPKRGEILVNNELTVKDKKDFLYGSNETGWLNPRDVTMGKVYMETLGVIYNKYNQFDIFINMFPKED
jgi:hypothetical protein